MKTKEKILRCMDGIKKLTENDVLFIDILTPSVIIYYPLHCALTDNELKKQEFLFRMLSRMGLVKDRLRYRNFIRHVRSYINLMRASNSTELLKEDAPIWIYVTSIDKEEVILNGYESNGKIDFSTPDETVLQPVD